jgi:hypothetical protein
MIAVVASRVAERRDEAITPRAAALPMQKSLGPLRGRPRLAPDDVAVGVGKPLVGHTDELTLASAAKQ